MINKQTNKKAGFELNTEFALAGLAIVIITIGLSLTYISAGDAKNQIYEMAPNITYQYPAIFTHTFLMLKLTTEEKEILGIYSNENYYVKDLVVIGTDESKKIYDDKKKEYLEKYAKTDTSSFARYKEFSNNNIEQNKLLCLTYEPSARLDITEYIKENNYFFYLRSYNGKYGYVKFYC